MTPKGAAFLTRVENGDRFTFREVSYQWRFLRPFFEPFYLTPDEAQERGVASPEECQDAREKGAVLVELAQNGQARFRLTDEGITSLREYRSAGKN